MAERVKTREAALFPSNRMQALPVVLMRLDKAGKVQPVGRRPQR